MSWLNEIQGFNSITEYNRFKRYIAERLAEEEIVEVKPKEYYSGGNEFGLNDERWFEDSSNGELWRLVPPDFPFKGLFEKVMKN